MSNRLQKKCVVAATGFHLLLALILMVGPAFLTGDSKHQTTPQINFIPSILIDEALQGGGDPRGGQPTPPPPAHTDPTPPVPRNDPKPPENQPERIKEPVQEPKPPKIREETKDTVELKSKPPKHEVKVDLSEHKSPTTTPNIKLNKSNKPNTSSSSDEAAAKKEYDRQMAAIRNAAGGIRNGTSGSTKIQIGVGGGGPTYASYESEVGRIYKQRYDLATANNTINTETELVVAGSVKVARDGTIISAKVTKPSKNPTLNKIAQDVLDSVTKLPAFPEGSTDTERTFPINFFSTPKQGLG